LKQVIRNPMLILNKYKLDEYLLFEPEEKKNTLSSLQRRKINRENGMDLLKEKY